MLKRLLTTGLIILGSINVLFAEKDHVLISRYPGSELSKKTEKDFAEYNLITGLDNQSNPDGEPISGKLTRLFYHNPNNRSILEIYRNYELALQDAGFEFLFQCADKECGPGYAASAWNRFNGITAKSGNTCMYLAAKLAGPTPTYVAVMVGRHRHQVDIVEVQSMESGLVTVDAAAMASSIERLGYVSLYGIYFDTNKAEIRPESRPTLQEIALLLENNPGLKLYVVGHTDSDGTLQYNMNLSQNRARAVVNALVAEHGIKSTRLSAHGVGPLSPKSSNTHSEGKRKNRRVELVKQK